MDAAARVEAVRARLEQGRGTIADLAARGPACRDCRHFALTKTGPVCRNPVFAKLTHDVVLGELREEAAEPVEKARSEKGLCGPEALLFDKPGRFGVVEYASLGLVTVAGGFAIFDETYSAVLALFF